MELPVFKLVINPDDETGFDYVSLVDNPAIEREWMAFKEKKPLFKFEATDKDRRIISGPIMVADLHIYRRDEERGEYYVLFDREACENALLKFMKASDNSAVNMMHQTVTDGVFMFEIFMIDSERGIATPKGFEELTDGSLFASFKVESDEIWENFIKTGKFKGFSIEGAFDQEHVGDVDEERIKELIDIINSQFDEQEELEELSSHLSNCIQKEMDDGKPMDQAVAICISKQNQEKDI